MWYSFFKTSTITSVIFFAIASKVNLAICSSSHTVNSEIFARIYFAKFREIKTQVKWQNHSSFTDIRISCPSHEFLTSQICLLMLFAKKNILTKISEFTVSDYHFLKVVALKM